MKKVLFYYGSMGSGGAERVLIQILKCLNREKYKIDLALISAKSGETLKYIPKDVRIISLWNGYSVGYKFAYRLSKWIGCNWFFKSRLNRKLDEDYDTEVSFLEGLPLKLHSLRTNKAKRISWVHIDINKYHYTSYAFYRNEEYKSYESMDKIVCVSKDVQDALLIRYPKLKNKTSVIYNSIDISDITDRASKQKINNKHFTIVSVCRLAEQKALDRLIRVAKKCKVNNLKINFQIIGSGPAERSLKLLSKTLGVDDMVIFKGYIENPMPYIYAADALLSTSLAEGFGLSICEAMCLGTPVISTKAAGPNEILGNNEFGLLCKQNDDAIYQAIEEIYYDEELRKTYSALGKERMKNFDVTSIIKQVEDIIG